MQLQKRKNNYCVENPFKISGKLKQFEIKLGKIKK